MKPEKVYLPQHFVPPEKRDFIDLYRGPHFSAYLDRVRELYAQIRFLGLPSYKDSSSYIALRQLFVPPVFSASPILAEKVEETDDGMDLMGAVTKFPRLVVLGDPGAGKSTFIGWICEQLTSFGRTQLSDMTGALLPIPLVLRDLVLPPKLCWDTLLLSFYETPVGELLKNHNTELRELLERGQAFILVDGLDEIPVLKRREVRLALWELWGRYPSCRCAMTSRIIGYEIAPFGWTPFGSTLVRGDHLAEFNERLDKTVTYKKNSAQGGTSGETESQDCTRLRELINSTLGKEEEISFEEIPARYVMPFNNNQIAQFARNWYASREMVAETDRISSEFISAIRSQQSLNTLARIPNLLTLMALIFRVHLDLPHGRAKLYSKISEAYLESIDKARRIPTEITMSLSDKERWLSEMAFEMQCQKASSNTDNTNAEGREILIGEQELLSSLESFFTRKKKTTLEIARRESRELLRIVSERSGLLIPRGANADGERYSFMHLSFQEYYAAQHLRRCILAPSWQTKADGPASISALRVYKREPQWTETICLLFESFADDCADDESWTDYLIDTIFEDEFSLTLDKDVDIEDGMRVSYCLMINLLHDPHAGISISFREKIARLLWKMFARRRVTEGAGRWTQRDSWISENLLKPSPLHAKIVEWGIKVEREEAKAWLFLGTSQSFSDWMAFLVALPHVQSISLWGVHLAKREFKELYQIPNLRSIGLDLTFTRDITPLQSFSHIEEIILEMGDYHGAVVFPDSMPMRTLRFARRVPTPLKNNKMLMPEVETFAFSFFSEIKEWAWILGYPTVSKLILHQCASLKNVNQLAALSNLKSIKITGCENVEALRVLEAKAKIVVEVNGLVWDSSRDPFPF